MKRRWFGYALWLGMAAGLYFFENNTGTRIVLLCSLLFPLIPPLRSGLFPPEETGRREGTRTVMARSWIRPDADEPGDVRLYQPGDPVRRIHWKLSAKKDELLIRESTEAPECAEEEKTVASPAEEAGKARRNRLLWILTGGILLCAVLLASIPEANRGAQALCNRLFRASEDVNAYVYDYFPVPDNQDVRLAAILLLCMPALLLAILMLLRRPSLTMGTAAACTLFQVYFGLSFSAPVLVPLYGAFALWMMRPGFTRKNIMAFGALLLAVLLAVTLFFPGTDAATEAASERVRDRLSRLSRSVAGTLPEAPEGETETRHVHTQTLETGDRAARTGREFRLVTEEEEQISMPHWVDYLKIGLLMLLAVALVILPFLPFLLLNGRKKKALEARKAFLSGDIREAVCAIFRQVIVWLNETGHGAGNRLYRDWAKELPDFLPEGYAERFARCAEDFEEAAYSEHTMQEEKRQRAMELLKETETALWETADRKQRFRLKYWMCLRE